VKRPKPATATGTNIGMIDKTMAKIKSPPKILPKRRKAMKLIAAKLADNFKWEQEDWCCKFLEITQEALLSDSVIMHRKKHDEG